MQSIKILRHSNCSLERKHRDIQTGDIITTTARRVPFASHKGIVVRINQETYVLHNDSYRGVNVDLINDFLSGRTVKYVEPSILNHLTYAELLHRFNANHHRSYDVLNYNCDHFICSMIGKKEESPQLQNVVVGISIITIFAILAKS